MIGGVVLDQITSIGIDIFDLVVNILEFINDYFNVITFTIALIGLLIGIFFNQTKDNIHLDIEFVPKNDQNSYDSIYNNRIVSAVLPLYDEQDLDHTSNFVLTGNEHSLRNIRAYEYEYDEKKNKLVPKREILKNQIRDVRPGMHLVIQTTIPEIIPRFGIEFIMDGYKIKYIVESQGQTQTINKYVQGKQSIFSLIIRKLLD